MGALDVVGAIGDQPDLSSKMELTCDGKTIQIPPGSQGIIITNISSYMGGVDVWEKSQGQINKSSSSMNDKKLELVAVYGSFHLGRLQVGLSKAIRIAQASSIEIVTMSKLPMQVDGEPFMQDPCMMNITWSSQTSMLTPR